MSAQLIGYARCSTDEQDLTAQRDRLAELGVADDRIYLDHGLTGTTRARPGIRPLLPARGRHADCDETRQVSSVSARRRAIGDDLAARRIKLSFGGQVYDPTDPMGKMFYSILAIFAEFEVDLLRPRTKEGMALARAKGKLRGRPPKLSTKQQRELARMYGTGEYSIAELADVVSVSRATVYRLPHPAAPQRRAAMTAYRSIRPASSSDPVSRERLH
jgi:DNA invertase Pin-like site-specific DNA recombinase